MKNKTNVFFGVLFTVFGIFVWVWSERWVGVKSYDPIGPAYFPRFMASLIILLSLVLIVQFFVTGRPSPKTAASGGTPPWVYRLAGVVLSCVVYLIILNPVGYILSTILFSAAVIMILGIRDTATVANSSIVLTLILFVLFSFLLNVLLPDGILAVFFS